MERMRCAALRKAGRRPPPPTPARPPCRQDIEDLPVVDGVGQLVVLLPRRHGPLPRAAVDERVGVLQRHAAARAHHGCDAGGAEGARTRFAAGPGGELWCGVLPRGRAVERHRSREQPCGGLACRRGAGPGRGRNCAGRWCGATRSSVLGRVGESWVMFCLKQCLSSLS